jgi:hypothetical protein
MSTPQTRLCAPASGAAGLGEDGEADGWLSAYEHRTGHVRPAPSPGPAHLVSGQARRYGGHRQ